MRVTRPAPLLAAPVLLGALALTGCSDTAAGRVAPVAVDEPIRSGVGSRRRPAVRPRSRSRGRVEPGWP